MILIMTRDKEVGESWHEMVCAYSIIIFGSKGNNTLIMERWNDSTKSNKKVAISIIIIISLKKEAVFPLCIFELFHVQPWVRTIVHYYFSLYLTNVVIGRAFWCRAVIFHPHIYYVWATEHASKNINIHSTPFILGRRRRSMLRIYIGKSGRKKNKREKCCVVHTQT